MVLERAKRFKYVHRRAGSGGNETAGPEETTTTTKHSTSAVTTIKSSSSLTEPKTESSGGVFLATGSSSEVSSASSAKSISSIPTSLSITSSKVDGGLSTSSSAIPTSISSISSDPLTLPTTSVESQTKSAASSGKQLIGSSSSSSSTIVSQQEVVESSPAAAPPPPATSAASVSTTAAPIPSTSSAVQPPPPVSSSSAVVSNQLPPPPAPVSSTAPTPVSSIIFDSAIGTESLTSIASPTYFSSTAPSVHATSANLLASPAAATSAVAQAPAGANNQPITATGPQGFTTTTIVGTAVGAAAGVALVALLALWCVRRHYRNRGKSMSPFSRRQTGGDRASFPPVSFISQDFRPGPAQLFGASKEPMFSKDSLSTISEKSAPSYTPPVRHSRSYTTSVLPPTVPARSVARPLSNVASPKQVPTSNPFLDPIETIDTSFMGTISAYFSSAPTTVTEPFLLGPNDNNVAGTSTNMSHKPSITSIYSSETATSALSPRTSVMPPITPALPTAISAPQELRARSPSPPPTSSPITAATTPTQQATSARASSSALGPSRYQSIGPWRDSMWSTSATPIMPTAMAQLGRTPSGSDRDSYFSSTQHSPSSPGHRLSKSLSSAAIDNTIGTAQSLYSPTSTPVSTSTSGFASTSGVPVSTAGVSPTTASPASARGFAAARTAPPPLPPINFAGPAIDTTIPLPPRSPLRAWPLRGQDSM